MKISIVVTYYANSDFLRACLDSLKSTTPFEVEIIVVQNNMDCSEHVMDIDAERFVVIHEYADLGYSAAANLGAKTASGDLLIFMDQDTIATTGWLDSLLRTYASSPNVGAASAKLVNPHTGRIVDFGIGFSQFNSPHFFLDRKVDHADAMSDFPVQAACSACLLIGKEDFHSIDGFDESLGNLYSDIDLCLRVKDLGKVCMMSANSVVYHFGTEISRFQRAYKDGYIKGDVKGFFWAKNKDRIEYDMDTFIKGELRKLAVTVPQTRDYYVCHMMNVADPNWYLQLVASAFPVNNVKRAPTQERDAPITSFYAMLGYDVGLQRIPAIFLVDRYVSIRENHVWWKMRTGLGDLVIDRHGNSLTVENALKDLEEPVGSTSR